MLLRDTVISVNTDILAKNMEAVTAMVGPNVAVMAVVKANGYGHGLDEAATVFMAHGARYLAVATLDEALTLRKKNANWPILILGYTPDWALPLVVEYDLSQMLFSAHQARLLDAAAAERGRRVRVHLKVDSGFHRLGTADVNELYAICTLPHLETEGIFTHLALVNDAEDARQVAVFTAVADALESCGMRFRYRHVADSISAVESPWYHMDMIRPGALLYGMTSHTRGSINVRPALTMETRISQIHAVKTGEGVGYDYLWRAPRNTRVATLPFGYADGYPRSLREKGYVTIRGVKCPFAGVICMDQCMVDISNVPDAREGDPAIIYGDGSGNTLSVAEAAALAGTNKNEILSRLTVRPPRVYGQ